MEGRGQTNAQLNSPWISRCAFVPPSLLRNWVKAAAAGKLNGAGSKAVTPEQMELSRMRAENARLRMENEILKKATAYFAKDAL